MPERKSNSYSRERAFQSFGSRTKGRKPFHLVNKAQKLSAAITTACAAADKSYRQTICQDARHESCDLVHMIRYANFRRLGDVRRVKAQMKAAEKIEEVYDLIPILRMCRCITPAKEGEIELELLYLKASYEGWLRSDLGRMVSFNNEAYEKAIRQLEFVIEDYFPDDITKGN